MESGSRQDETTRHPCDASGPFRATQWWNKAVEYLIATLSTTKGHSKGRLTVLSGSNSHSGRTVANVLMTFAKENRQNFTSGELTREKVVKLCQVMLDCQVISCASGHEKKFRDTDMDFYTVSQQLNSSSSAPLSPMHHFSSALLTRLESFGRGRPQQSMKLKPERLKFHDVVTPFARLKVHPTEKGNATSEMIEENSSKNLSVADTRKFGSLPRISPSKLVGAVGLGLAANVLSPGVEPLDWFPFEELLDDSLTHDLALFRLLTLIDLPVLDNILHVRDKILPKAIEQIFPGLSNSVKRSVKKKNQNSRGDATPCILGYSASAFADSWVVAGCKCAYLSDRSQEDLVTLSPLHRRHFVFSKVAETHRNCPGPLIPQNYNDIVKQIYSLKQQQQKGTAAAIEAAQLLMLLLPRETRLHLRNLLSFMMLVSQDATTRICDELSNMDAVLNAFGSSILQCCDTEMSRPHYLGLLEFFVTHWEEIFLVPASFREEVKSRLEGQKYTAAVPVPSFTYCSRISATDFSREGKLTSDAELINLVNAVVDDTKLSRQYKESFLEKFRLEHPVLYSSNFPDLK